MFKVLSGPTQPRSAASRGAVATDLRRALDGGDCRFAACGTYGKHVSGFEFSLLQSIIHALPAASNANRWALVITRS
jgi:hypothetical protein